MHMSLTAGLLRRLLLLSFRSKAFLCLHLPTLPWTRSTSSHQSLQQLLALLLTLLLCYSMEWDELDRV